MSNGDQRNDTPSRGLILAVFIIVTLSFFGPANQWRANVLRASESAQRPATKQQTADALQHHPRASGADILAQAGFVLSFWQTLLNGFGLAALGLTVFYAHKAWEEAKRSARIAETSLEGAIADAAEQAERFSRQLAISEQNLELSRKSIAEADRAWVAIGIQPTGGLAITDERISINARVVLENVGKGPAIGFEETCEMTFDLVGLDDRIRSRIFVRHLAGRFGAVLFPGSRAEQELNFSASRSDMDAAIANDKSSKSPKGVFVTLAYGGRYFLPGETEPRLTYRYLTLYKAQGGRLTFDDGQTWVALHDLRWRDDVLSGPIT
ncbi:hypothetical protein [Phenylobacterium sp.]|uniref:hypothetical protein n=1 Tax=Phenylobacterium sp. TaxID=1871053 RepID=UPI0026336542|nr:hypothetical protein [Phenylobacterium sp.]